MCNAAIGPHLSGPGIRYWEFARVLSACAELDVTLVTVPGIRAEHPQGQAPFRLQASRDEAHLQQLAANAQVVVAPGAIISLYPALRKIRPPLVVDLYIPLLLEELQRTPSHPLAEQSLFFDRLRRNVSAQIIAADFILCASEKQRDYWLGALSALGRINPYTHADDPTLRRLIDVVPFGLPSEPPRRTRRVLKGIYPGIGPNDKVIFWGGGVWDWLDAPTLIRAMARLAERRPDVKLFFMGVKHPNPQERERKVLAETIALSQELGLLNRTVYFNEWVAYEERSNYLLEADLGVSLHRDHLETRFAFRTRFLDYLWAGLPMLVTRGDVLSEEVERQGLGRVVEPGDVAGVAQALVELLATPNLRETYHPRFERVAAAYRWEVVAQPLVAFCQSPRLAPDKGYLRGAMTFALGPTPWWRLPSKAWRAVRVGGVAGLSRQIGEYRRWLLTRRGSGRPKLK
ncbi:MAG TPA: glycosyltransferase family 4 protein [Anaerolineae bacterium]|nr:glycosyltransferase family 4 protein [Anaerolineae bacterium]